MEKSRSITLLYILFYVAINQSNIIIDLFKNQINIHSLTQFRVNSLNVTCESIVIIPNCPYAILNMILNCFFEAIGIACI